MNMLKVLKLSVLSLLIFNTSVYAAKSPVTPLNGIYVSTSTNFCTADSTNIPPAGALTSYNSASVGQGSFTPDATYIGATNAIAFAAWVSSLATKTPAISSPVSVLNATQDPTTTAVLKLTETPIEWGVMSSTDTEAFFNTPYTYKPTDNNNAGNKPVFITSFTYALPANNNNVATGYALYGWSKSANSWKRLVLYLNQPANVKSTSFVAHKIDSEQSNIGSGIYTFDCVLQIHATQ